MKLEAMKKQGARTDLTSSQVVTETSDQVGQKSENLAAKIYALKSEHDANGNWKVGQGNVIAAGIRADELLAKQVGENRMTIQRYIRLTNLIPKLLDMVDEGKVVPFYRGIVMLIEQPDWCKGPISFYNKNVLHIWCITERNTLFCKTVVNLVLHLVNHNDRVCRYPALDLK